MYHKVLSSIAGVALALIVAGTAAFAAAEPGKGAPRSGAMFGAAITGTTPTTGTTPISGTTGVTGTTSPGQQKIAGVLANKFGTTLEDVMELRAETGWGNVFKILMVAQLSGKTPAEVLALREDEKQGWGNIYKNLDVKPGKKENLGQSLKAATPTPAPTASAAPQGKKPVPTVTPTPQGKKPLNQPGNKPDVPPGQNKGKGNNGKGND